MTGSETCVARSGECVRRSEVYVDIFMLQCLLLLSPHTNDFFVAIILTLTFWNRACVVILGFILASWAAYNSQVFTKNLCKTLCHAMHSALGHPYAVHVLAAETDCRACWNTTLYH